MLDIDELFNGVSEKQLDDILRSGEGEQIEFRETTPNSLDLAKHISAFANARGGVFVVGAREQRPQITFSGPNRKVDKIFDAVSQRVRPLPPLRMHRVNYRGALVPVIVVKRYLTELVVSDAGAFIRVGNVTEPMPGDQVLARLNEQPQQAREERSADEISRLTSMLDDLTKKLDASQSWKAQKTNLLVGCAGSTLSTFLVWLFGIIVGALLLYFFDITWR